MNQGDDIELKRAGRFYDTTTGYSPKSDRIDQLRDGGFFGGGDILVGESVLLQFLHGCKCQFIFSLTG